MDGHADHVWSADGGGVLMPVRFNCDLLDFEQNWVDVADKWTRAEFKQVIDVTDIDGYLDWFRRKVTACNIVLDDGIVITDPATVTEAMFDNADVRLWGFVSSVIYKAVTHMQNLGNFSARPSSESSAKKS